MLLHQARNQANEAVATLKATGTYDRLRQHILALAVHADSTTPPGWYETLLEGLRDSMDEGSHAVESDDGGEPNELSSPERRINPEEMTLEELTPRVVSLVKDRFPNTAKVEAKRLIRETIQQQQHTQF